MPVDPKVLEACIKEAAGDDAELATQLTTKLTANDGLASKFVAGFMRNADYTQKAQAIADERKTFGTQAQEVERLRAQLTAADTEKNKILNDLATHRVSTAKARELFKILQDKYDLSDADLPGMSDLIETAKTGKKVDTTDDLETRLTALKTEITSSLEKKFVDTLGTELGSMADLDVVWPEISYEHEQLTGKPMTPTERRAVLTAAKKGEGTLRQVWEKQFNITGDDGLRMQKRDEANRKKWEEDREKTDAEKRSRDALNVVSPQGAPDLGTGPGISAAFKTRFRTFEMDPNKAPIADNGGVPSLEVKPGQHVRQTGDRGPSAAQRAAAKFLEKGGPAGYAKKTA